MLFSLIYYVIADEVASTGTHHTHIYIYASSPIRFRTIKNRLPTAHIEKAYGTSQQNRDYILKTAKEYTEYGQLPTEKSEKAPEMQQLIEAIQNGKRPAEIIEEEKVKPEGIPIELADCIIRILDYCGKKGIDIEEAIRIKHEYNKTRPYRHGGKKI
jgi:NTP pyrophosphatase (non-canonical NTP hydrolase)